MRTAIVIVLLLIGLPVPHSAGTAVAAGCQFELGFRTIYDLIPDTVGECAADQGYNPANGDALQQTAGGMLVWRKSDNFTAFTDGYRSWVNGPYGLQERLNTERFEWETPVKIGVSCSPSAADVSFSRFTGDADGTATSEGSIRNPCSYPLNVIIDIFASASRDGPVIMDGQSIYVKDLPPGEARSVTATVPNAISAAWFTWKLTEVSLEQPACPAGERCFYLDPWLASAVEELKSVTDGEWLLKTAEERRVRIRRGGSLPGTLGQYESRTRTVTVDNRLDSYSSWVRAAVLAHELQHAADHTGGRWVETTEACLQAEDSAFRRMAQTWSDLWQKRLPLVGDDIHWQLNEVSTIVERDPNRFTSTLVERYKMLCQR